MSDALFRRKAPAIMQALIGEFGCTVEDAAAVAGNLGHESGGFKFLQEKKPLVAGSRGGWGWAQWTGDRRKQFENWCASFGLDPSSDEANQGYLHHELRGSERRAMPALMAAEGLEAKVIAFERNFERAGVKHYPSRTKWAHIALDAWAEMGGIATWSGPKADVPLPQPRPAVDAAVPLPNDASDKVLVEAVQRRLQALGYREIGPIDGDLGGATTGVIAMFQHDRGIPTTCALDAALRAELAKAEAEGWTRPIGYARRNGEPADSRIVKAAEKQGALGWLGGLAGGGGILAWLGEQLDSLRGLVFSLKSFVAPFGHLLADWWPLLALGAGGYVVWQAAKARQARVEDYRARKTA